MAGEQVLFGIIAIVPLRRIVRRKKDVVKVNENAWFQFWKDVQEYDRRVGVRENPVRMIHEQNVAALEGFENIEVHLLDWLFNQPVGDGSDFRSGPRVHADDGRIDLFILNGAAGETRGMS